MTFRELYPTVAAAVVWGKQWTYERIMFVSDNLATMFIIQKMRLKCLPIMKLMRTLTWIASVNNFHFSSRHLPGRLNTVADNLSRLLLQESEKLPHKQSSFRSHAHIQNRSYGTR